MFPHRILIVLVLAILTWDGGLSAQVECGTIAGTVRDTSGAVVPNVAISVKKVNTGVEFKTTTHESGEYVAPNLIPGEYSLTASAPGFSTLARHITSPEGPADPTASAMETPRREDIRCSSGLTPPAFHCRILCRTWSTVAYTSPTATPVSIPSSGRALSTLIFLPSSHFRSEKINVSSFAPSSSTPSTRHTSVSRKPASPAIPRAES